MRQHKKRIGNSPANSRTGGQIYNVGKVDYSSRRKQSEGASPFE
jgi:hypothetical protein